MEKISQFEIFNGIKSSTLEKLIQLGKIVEFKKGNVIIRARESVDWIAIQLTGKSIGYTISYNGKRKILFIYGKGSLLNGYVFNNITSSIYCEIIEESQLFVIPVIEFTKLMENDFQLTKNVLIMQEKKIWKLRHRLKNEGHGIPIDKKLIAKLLKLSRDFGIKSSNGIEIDMDLSITFLGDMLGTPRETASRACAYLINEGLIKIEKKRITILNREEMIKLYKLDKK